ncbi:hypothetical protein BDFB_013856, partial [Asbolus verrucosus]
MDLETLNSVLKVGRIFALTPSSTENRKPSIVQKCYIIFVFLTLTVGVGVSLYLRRFFYTGFPPIQFLLRIIMDVDLYLHNCYSLLILMVHERERWFKLIKNLRAVDCAEYKNHHCLTFISTHIAFVFSAGFNLFAWFTVLPLGHQYVNQYSVENFQIYTQFFYTVFAYIILKMILARYKYQTSLLRKRVCTKRQLKYLKKIKRNIFFLKDSVDVFNDVFGWIFLFNVIFGVARSLIYLDLTQLQKCFGLVGSHKRGFHILVSENRPEFTAARFFSIDKSTIFSVLDAMTTFLLVII